MEFSLFVGGRSFYEEAISIDLIKPRLMDFSKSQQPIYYL